jgi:hypothetical protein
MDDIAQVGKRHQFAFGAAVDVGKLREYETYALLRQVRLQVFDAGCGGVVKCADDGLLTWFFLVDSKADFR